MVEILLGQNLIHDAKKIINQLAVEQGETPRICELRERLRAVSNPPDPTPTEPQGKNQIRLVDQLPNLIVEWEITPAGLELGKRVAKYSGHGIVRLFTASPGPRGVRTSYQDIPADPAAAKVILPGLPKLAVHVAAVGFLCNTGEFIPLLRTEPLEVTGQ